MSSRCRGCAHTLPNLPGAEERWSFEPFLAVGTAVAEIDLGESVGSPEGRALYPSLCNELAG